MINRTIRGLLEYLADNGGTVIDLENGVSGFGPDLTNAAEEADLIIVVPSAGGFESRYRLSGDGWLALGRTPPPTIFQRLQAMLGLLSAR